MTTRAEFGISITPDWSKQEESLDLARAADDGGLDLIGIQDHPYQWRFHDTWTLIAFLAGKSSRIRFFPDVANLPLRPPAILAKSAASLDVLTGGRIELGLGAGGFLGGDRSRGRAEAYAFIFWPGTDDPLGQVEPFASEVAPALRAAFRG
jgi:alkanesulfonate monooxygenase SsuD/methylene tetrahydromethanopterin reductase-like flavin-dependent oxidoreductase (luciferase family)